MKKSYMMGATLLVIGLAGCTLKGPQIPELSTDDVQIDTGTSVETTGMLQYPPVSGSEIGDVSGQIDTVEVPMVSGSAQVIAEQSGLMNRLQNLINKRNTQPKDETKLTEEDIDLMEQIIQKIKEQGK